MPITSLGGPLVAVPQSVLGDWFGAEPPPGVDDDADWNDEEDSDYWRACRVADLAGVIDVDSAQALVVQTPSVPTGYMADAKIIVQRMAKTSVVNIADAVRAIAPSLPWRSVGRIQVREPLLLFDATFPGNYARTHQHILMSLEGGEYGIDVTYVEPGPAGDLWLTMVRLVGPGGK
jgi:hypothetical protein